MEQTRKTLPLIPLRGIITYPYMVFHFDVGREKSIAALDAAMLKDQEVFLAGQIDPNVEEPVDEAIYEHGAVCKIKQILKLPGNTVRVLVEGKIRGKVIRYLKNESFYEVEVNEFHEPETVENAEVDALIRAVKKAFEDFVSLSNLMPKDTVTTVTSIQNPSKAADVIAAYMNLNIFLKQDIIETVSVEERLERLLEILENELDVLKIEKKINSKMKNRVDKMQKEAFLREQLRIIQEELGEYDDGENDMISYSEKISKAKLPKEVKEKANSELKKLRSNGPSSPESGNIKTYLDWILDIKWNKVTKENYDIKNAKEVLEKDHYGLLDVKTRIIEYIAVKKMSNSLKSPIICLVGPPGVGKTSIASSIAKAVNRDFVRISLGGVKDEAEIRGHRRTYVGSIPGRIIYGLKHAKSMNPVMLLDEIDKMHSDFKGNPTDALLEVLDPEQNSTFRDHYLELNVDLSKVMFIATANSLDTIPRPLLDRMEIIEVTGYTVEEKLNIAKKYLIPNALKAHSIEDDKIKFSDSSIKALIEGYTRESGVRGLNREISAIIRKAITDMVENNKDNISVTNKHVIKYLEEPIFSYEKFIREDKVGCVTGMAWTAYGGDTLPVEVTVMDGNGKLELTGQLGDVMKESAKTAYSYVRSMAKEYNIESDFYKTKDVHIHVPEGAVPKDGPSAGITMVTAIVSALSKRKVKSTVAMTGEVTLSGRVLPIGGLKEKALAAHRVGINTLIIPKDNSKHLKDIPQTIKNKINFILVDDVKEVLINALAEG